MEELPLYPTGQSLSRVTRLPLWLFLKNPSSQSVLRVPVVPEVFKEGSEHRRNEIKDVGTTGAKRNAGLGPSTLLLYDLGQVILSLCLSILICQWGSHKPSCPTYLTGLL